MISVSNLTVEFSGVPLFNNISFLMNPRDRIGLTGKNGAGKSTLLKVLCGLQPYDSGQVAVPKGVTIGYLPQQLSVEDKRTVYAEAQSAFVEVKALEKEIAALNNQLAERTDYESDEYMALINRLTEKNDRFHLLNGQNIDGEIESTLLGLGFERTDFERPTAEFSGGWRMRIELAKVILRHPDVLLLDEPTNHLDIESVQWFEDMLKTYEGAVMVVSHDRAFLDNLTTRTIEISLGKIYDFKVPYSQYVVQRQEQLEQQMAAYENQQKMIEDTEKFIERFRYKATKAVQVQSRIKQLEKVERIEVDEFDTSSIHFRFPPAPHSGQIVVETKAMTKRFGDNLVLNDIDFTLERGQKVAFVGRNGEGKTTMAKVILGIHPCEGTVKIGHNVKIGYYAQNQSEMLDDNKTVFQTIDEIAKGEIRTKIRDILAAFLFRGEDIDKKVSVLSGGEKARLSMAKLLLEPANLLVLDEPTNHLDMRSKDILKQALMAYDGTLIVVSHDRDFLDGMVNIVYEFRSHKMKQHLGGISDFLYRKKLENMRQLEMAPKQEKTDKPAAPKVQSQPAAPQSKLSYEEQKEQEKRIRKAKKAVEDCEARIVELESAIADMDDQLANRPESADNEFFAKYEATKKQLADELNNWERLTEEAERMG